MEQFASGNKRLLPKQKKINHFLKNFLYEDKKRIATYDFKKDTYLSHITDRKFKDNGKLFF